MLFDPLSYQVIGAAIEVHSTLGGPGLRELIYEAALLHELRMRGIPVHNQVPVPVTYKGKKIKRPMILDLLIDNSLIVEIKALEENSPLHRSQLLTYLRLTGVKVGLIINFGQRLVKEGLFRVVNTHIC